MYQILAVSTSRIKGIDVAGVADVSSVFWGLFAVGFCFSLSLLTLGLTGYYLGRIGCVEGGVKDRFIWRSSLEAKRKGKRKRIIIKKKKSNKNRKRGG